MFGESESSPDSSHLLYLSDTSSSHDLLLEIFTQDHHATLVNAAVVPCLLGEGCERGGGWDPLARTLLPAEPQCKTKQKWVRQAVCACYLRHFFSVRQVKGKRGKERQGMAR